MFAGYIFFGFFVLSLIILPFLPKRIMAWYISKVIAKFLFLEGTIEGREKYYNFKNTQSKGIVIFNHPSFHDMIPICHALAEPSRGVIKSKYLIGPLKIFAHRLNLIAVDEVKKGVAAIIIDAVNSRQKGDNLICISPVGGTNLYNQDDVPEFRKGAFLAMPAVLPIIIYYSNFEVWNTQTLFGIVYGRTNGEKLYYHAQIMDPIFPKEKESVEEYMKRVREYVAKGIAECKTKPNREEHDQYNIKEYLLELAYTIFILFAERNVILLGIFFYLELRRWLDATPQYEFLVSIYLRLLFLKIVVFYLLG